MIDAPQRGALQSADGAAVQAAAGADSRTALGMDEPSRLKRAAAQRAVDYLQSRMTVGLGAGSTARFAMRRLAELITSARLTDIVGIPCSRQVAEEADRLGIELSTLDRHPVIDTTIDGADEVDPDLNLIKGAGGALLHEKMVEQASRRVIIVVDSSKPSPVLGLRRAVPVEVVEFGWRAQARYLEAHGARVDLRLNDKGTPFRTDEGHLILDCTFGPIEKPRELAALLEARAGIVEHGLFLDIATDVLVGESDGVRHLSRNGQAVQR
jgi:ribose 5-phosphate isomerase A